jgi:hypothetical protein
MYLATWVLISTVAPLLGGTETGPRIVHDAPACIVRSTSGFPVVRVTIAPPHATAERVRIHVRATEHPRFFPIDLVEKDGSWEAALPEPGPDTNELVYFLQVVNQSVPVVETPEYRVRLVEQMASDCSTGQPAQSGPPEEEQKKKKKSGLYWAIGAAVGAGLGLGLLSTGGEEETSPGPPMPPPEPPSPPEPPIPPTPPAVEACFDIPRSERVGVPVRIDASCSSPRGSLRYEWRLGDGRSREGRVINPVYGSPGLYIVELTVFRLESAGGGENEDRLEKPLLIVAPPPEPASAADLALSKSGLLSSRIVDGVLEFHLAYTLRVTNLGPGPAAGIELRDPLAADLTPTALVPSVGTCQTVSGLATCDLGTIAAGGVATVRLEVDVRPGVAENTLVTNTATVSSPTADPALSNNTATETTLLVRPSTLSRADSTSRFLSTLSSRIGDGSTSGVIRIAGGSGDVVNDTSPFEHRFRSSPESIVVEATILSAAGEARWRFDFSADPRFAPGSIDVRQGEVLSRETNAVTFRLSGQPGERVRFLYRLYD